MKRLSIGFKFAVGAFFLASLLIVTFAAISLFLFRKEQIDGFRDIDGSITSGALTEVDESLYHLLIAYLIAVPAAACLAAMGAWVFARAALRPLHQLEVSAQRITANNLSERLPIPNKSDDIGRISLAFNQLLDRLQKSFGTLSRFTADAAHHLRTPLAIISCELQASLRHNLRPPNSEQISSLLEETNRLSGIVDRLLLLAKADSDSLILHRKIIDFSFMCGQIAEDIEILSQQQHITVHADLPSGLFVSVDPALMQLALLNLLENAFRYNTPGGFIRIRLTGNNEMVTVRIENSGAPIPEELKPIIFERFVRADQNSSLQEDRKGSGLGLSIATEIVNSHGGSLTLRQSDKEKTVFQLQISTAEKISPQVDRNSPAAEGVRSAAPVSQES